MADVPGVAPALVPNQPHSEEHGSVENELLFVFIRRLEHQKSKTGKDASAW